MNRPPVPAGPRALRIGYVVVLCFATLVPFGFELDPGAVLERLGRAFSPELGASDYVDAVRNLALFAGWGLLWTLTSRSRRDLRLIGTAVATGAAISLGLESAQLFSEVRHSSVLDLLNNTAGAALGSGGAVVVTRALSSRLRRRSYLGLPILLFLMGYGLAVLVETTFPSLRQDLLQVWGGPLNRLAGALAAFELASITELPWLEGLLFAPAGAICVATLAEETRAGYARAAARTALGGTLVMATLEVAHGAASYPVQLGPLAIHSAGIALGAAAAAWGLPAATRRVRGRHRPLAFGALYAALLLLWVLRPYDVTLQPSALADEFELSRFIPLSAHGVRRDLYSVADVVKLFSLYLPLGGLLGVWPLKRRGFLRGVLPVLYLAALGEAGQILIASRFFDITDILVAAAGATVGWATVRRAGFGRRGELFPAGTAGPG